MTIPRTISDVVADVVLDAAHALRRTLTRARTLVAHRRDARAVMRFTARDRADALLRPAPVAVRRPGTHRS